jgi:hypothetical protein
MNIYEKLLAIQQDCEPLLKDTKLSTENRNSWVSDAQVRRLLRPLLLKHKVFCHLVSSEVIHVGENRIIRIMYEYVNVENTDEIVLTTVDYEIGGTDLTGVGITLAVKYANINTFFLETSMEEEGGGKPLGLVASPAEKAMVIVEKKKVDVAVVDQSNLNYSELHEEWDTEFEKARKLGIKVDDYYGFKVLNFDYREMLKSHGLKATQKEKQILCTSIKLGVIDEYMSVRFPEFVYVKRDKASPLFANFSYQTTKMDEPIKGFIPSLAERESNDLSDRLEKFLADKLKIDLGKLERYITNSVNAGEIEDLAWDANRNCQDIKLWLRVASPLQINEIVTKFVASVT